VWSSSNREPLGSAGKPARRGRRTDRAWSAAFRGYSRAATLLVASAAAALGGCESFRSEEPPAPAPAPSVAPAPPSNFAPILFDSGSVKLTMQARKQVHNIASDLQHPSQKTRAVVIEGYSDSTGSAEGNRAISRERAETVARELVFNGLSRDRIRIEAYGAERPARPNTDDQGKPDRQGQAANRRVEVRLAE